MKKKEYQAILMDVDGTLLDFNKAEVLGIREVMKAYGVEPSKEKEELYHQINKGLWESFERGEIPKQQIMDTRFALFFEKLDEIQPGTCSLSLTENGPLYFGLTKEELGIQAEKKYRRELDEGAFLIPGALEICRYLAERYPVYVVTNGVSKTQYKRIERSGLSPYFKEIFVSEDAKSQKPQKEFFQYCFSRIPDCRPEDMIIIGDSLTSDIKGGCAAGTDTCWYNPTGAANKDPAVRVDYEIGDLMELKEIL